MSFVRQKTWEALFWASKVLALVWRNVWIRRLRRQMMATVLELALAAFALAHLPPGSKGGAASAGAYHERELRPPEQLDMYHVPEQLVLDVSTDVLVVFADKIKQKGRFTNLRHRYMRLFVNGREVDEPTAPGRIPKDKMRKIWITVVNSEKALLDKCANESFKGVCALVRTNVVGNDKSVNYTCYLNGNLSPPVLRTRRAGYALRIAPIEGEISECQNLIESVLLGNYITDALPSVHAASQMFPLPRYPTPPPMDNVIASMCFLITYMMPFSRSVWTIVEENSSGMASMLRSMGTSDTVYWLAHFVATFLHISFYSLMAVFFMMYNTYQVTPGSFSFEDYQHVQDYAPYLNEHLVRRDLLVALFTLFGVQTTLHVMLLSCVNTRPLLATLLAAFYWMAMFAMSKPWVTLEDYLFDDRYPKYLAAMFPVNMLYTSFFHIRWTIYFGSVADWKILSWRAFHVDNLRLGSSWQATILTCVAMLAAIWYLTHALPSVCDHPLAPGFLFTKNYWFPYAVEVLEVGTMTPPEQQPSTYFEELPEGVTIVVRTHNLTKEYAKIKALNKVSLEALDKQITVILGTDGAGKSTLLKVLSGSIPVTSGQATVCDMDVGLSRHIIRMVTSFCPRQAMFSIDMTVWEHLLLYAVLKGVPIRNIRARAREVLIETEFNDKVESYPHLLSAGAQKRLQLAISLLNKPRVLLLDEPTYLLDEEARREVWTLLEAIRSSCAIVMTSAMTEEADLIGDRVAIMSHGRVRCCGTPTFLKKAHGTGYEIRFPKTKNVLDAQDKLLEIVQQRTARARLSQTPRSVIISLGTRDMRGFADMFKRIEKFCQDHDIDDIGVAFTTLEDVFIKMSTEPDNVYLNIDNDIEMSHTQAFCDEPLRRPSFCGQMAALLSKRRAMLAVDRAAPFAVYVLFVVMTFVMEYLQSGPGWLVDLFPELVSPPRDTSFLRQSTNADGGVDIDIGDMYPRTVSFLRGSTELSTHFYLPLVRGVTVVQPIETEPAEELDRLSRKDFFSYSQNCVFGADFSDPGSPQVWWNPYVPYSKSIATSLKNSALLRYFSGDAGAVFRLRVRAFSRRATGEPEVESGAHTVVRDTSGFVERGLRSFSPWRKVLLPPIVGLAGAAFVVAPVAETASGSKRLQLMTGVPGFAYWLSHYLFDGCLYAILWVSAAFLFVMNNKVRADTALALFLLVLLGFPTLTGVSYLTSFFAKSVGIWYILLFCVYMAFALQASTLSINYAVLHWLFTLLPPYAFSSGVVKLLLLDADNHLCHEYATATDGVHDLLKIACDDTRAQRATLELAAIDICCQNRDENDGPPYTVSPFDLCELCVGVNLLVLLIEGIAMFVVVSVLDSGTLFVIRNVLAERHVRAVNEVLDTDVENEAREAARLAAAPGLENRALVLRDIWRFPVLSRAPQLRGVNLCLAEGECFGLLGARRSGKTLLLEVLGALAVRTSGDAYSQKGALSSSPRKWQSQIGYCPASGGLLSSLAVTDQLTLFARLRGVPREHQETCISGLIGACNLNDKRFDCPRDFGISDKRKLSLAIALIGAPSLVFLDEPLKGVDTGTSQRLFDLLTYVRSRAKATTIIYASVSMQQLEFTCDRLAIMVDGQLQCVGTIEYLRDKFGQGMVMKIQLAASEIDRNIEVQPVMTALFPDSRLIYYHQGLLSFEMTEKRPWSEVFSNVELLMQGFQCEYLLVSEATLEEVYMAFTK